MSEFEGSAPSASEGAAADTASSETQDAASTTEGLGAAHAESADAGLAPGVGDDSFGAGEVAAPTSAPSEFVFAGRKFASQQKAEEWAKSLGGRVPDLQRKTAQYEQEMARARQDMEAMQALILRLSQQGGQGQGPQVAQSPAKPRSFAESLAEGGENSPLAFIASLAEEKGIAHALYAFAEQQENFVNERIDRALEERVQPLQRRDEFQQRMNAVTGAARKLAHTFPELDESNSSPEAKEAQDEIVAIWKTYPPELQLNDPERAWKLAVMEYRDAHGTPQFATPPGTSGSPSARAAMASEAGFAGAASTPIEGTGTPRPRPNGAPVSPEDAFEAEILGAEDQYAKNLDGKSLGWRRVRP